MKFMGFNIHRPGDSHVPRFSGPDAPEPEMFLPWPDAAFDKIVAAIATMMRRVQDNQAACDEMFRASGGGRTVAELLAQEEIWISYNPLRDDDAPSGFAYGNEILIFERALQYSPMVLASVVTHELDHVNGIRGEFMPLNRYAHGLADHAAMQCIGVVSPRTQILNPLGAYFKCAACRP